MLFTAIMAATISTGLSTHSAVIGGSAAAAAAGVMFIVSVIILAIAIVILKKSAATKNMISPGTPPKPESEDIELQDTAYATISDVITNPSGETNFNII